MSDRFELFDSITESTTIIDRKGDIVFTNKAWSEFSTHNSGDEASTGIAVNYFQVCDQVTGEEREMAVEAKNGIQKVIDSEEEVFELEYPCHSPSENRWFILRASSISTKPEYTLVTHINITKRKIAEIELEKNYHQSLFFNERLNTTLYRVVHDIQSPVNGIKGLIDLSKSEEDLETISEYLRMIGEGSDNLKAFIQETLKEITSPSVAESLDVEALIRQYLMTVEPLFKVNDIEVRIDINQKAVFISKEVEFRSIFSNLISNALKYFDRKKANSFVEIHFTCDENDALLVIKDNGIGISQDDIPKLLDLNFQVHKGSSEGEGLGLFLVNQAVQLLGGACKLESQFGEWTEFRIELPAKMKTEEEI